MIYIIGQKDENLYKVGFSGLDFHDRVRNLQIGNPNRLDVVAAWPKGTKLEEAALHQWLRYKGAAVRGEWYRLTLDELDAVVCQADACLG